MNTKFLLLFFLYVQSIFPAQHPFHFPVLSLVVSQPTFPITLVRGGAEHSPYIVPSLQKLRLEGALVHQSRVLKLFFSSRIFLQSSIHGMTQRQPSSAGIRSKQASGLRGCRRAGEHSMAAPCTVFSKCSWSCFHSAFPPGVWQLLYHKILNNFKNLLTLLLETLDINSALLLFTYP